MDNPGYYQSLPSLLSYNRGEAKAASFRSWKMRWGLAYLIFVTNAANAVRVKFLAECKTIPEKRENNCFGLRLYRSSNVLFYTKCVILHLVCNFTLSV